MSMKKPQPGSEEGDRVVPGVERATEQHPFRSGFMVGAAVTVVITLLIVQNGDTVEVEWFLFSLHWPLWVVLLIPFVGGMIAWQLFLFEIHRLSKSASERRTEAGRVRGFTRRKDKRSR